jgi:hypothetical protein
VSLLPVVGSTCPLLSQVLIVDEVDDLIINERPNAHYVKKDVEQTPDLCKCYEVLQAGGAAKPEGVADSIWEEAVDVRDYCEHHVQLDRHYRVVEEDNASPHVIMLDAAGNRPKVPHMRQS